MINTQPFFQDKRGTSINVQYVLTLSVALVMLTGLSTGLSGITDTRQENVAQDQLEIATGEVATQLNYDYQVKQQHDATRSNHMSTSQQLKSITYVDTPDLSASNTYIVEIASDGGSIVATTTTSERYQVETPIDKDIPVKSNTGATGGDVAIVYDRSVDKYQLISQSRVDEVN